MFKRYKFAVLFFVGISLVMDAQPWSYNFGANTGNFISGISTDFLPPAPSGTDRLRVSTNGGGFWLENQSISFGSGSYMRAVAPTGGSVNKFSVYDYPAGKVFTLSFRVRFGDSDGGSTASSGAWLLIIGDGATFSDNNTWSGTQVFTLLKFAFGAGGAITCSTRVGTSWVQPFPSAFSQGNNYLVDIVANNSTSTVDYGTDTVAANKYDIYVNGTKVGDGVGKAGLANDVNMDSFMFYGESSTGNVANIFIDDIVYSNTATSLLPVELTSFTAKSQGTTVNLMWETKTEIDNNGFEVERNSGDTWQKIGFVEGHGTTNSPKYYNFTDKNATGHKIQYRLKQIDNAGTFEYSPVVEVELNPVQFALYQNYPNPFNPSTVIRYALPVAGVVTIDVFNALGEKVSTLLNGQMEAGYHEVSFDAAALPSGLYFYKISAGDFTSVKKMLLMK